MNASRSEKIFTSRTLSLAVIGFLIVISVIYWKVPVSSEDKFRNYMMTISSLVVAISFIILAFQEPELVALEATQNRRNRFLQIYQLLLDKLPLTFLLYKEMNQNDPQVMNLPEPADMGDPSVRATTENVVAKEIFRMIEYIYKESDEWTPVWKDWLRSGRLRSIWASTKGQYSVEFQRFIDRIIGEN